MTDRRRPAAAGRLLAAGVTAATTLSLTGLFALEPATATDDPATVEVDATNAALAGSAATPRKVVVVVRRIHLDAPPASSAGSAAPRVARAPAAPVPASTRSQPRTRTRGS